jgi:4'-phosphopantetheinyl transferase
MTHLADHHVRVAYCLTAHLTDDVVRAAVERLSAEERARHDTFVLRRSRRDFAVAHDLLRRTLSAHGGRAPHEWAFTSSAHGKPTLTPALRAETGLSFNLAHTDGLVACAVVREEAIGIDVETIDRGADAFAVARRFFSAAEIVDLERCAESTRPTRFVEIWTLKEAYVKAVGNGLALPMNDFGFVLEGPSSIRFETARDAPGGSWQFALFSPSARHRMAIAIGGPSVRNRRLTVCADSAE